MLKRTEIKIDPEEWFSLQDLFFWVWEPNVGSQGLEFYVGQDKIYQIKQGAFLSV